MSRTTKTTKNQRTSQWPNQSLRRKHKSQARSSTRIPLWRTASSTSSRMKSREEHSGIWIWTRVLTSFDIFSHNKINNVQDCSQIRSTQSLEKYLHSRRQAQSQSKNITELADNIVVISREPFESSEADDNAANPPETVFNSAVNYTTQSFRQYEIHQCGREWTRVDLYRRNVRVSEDQIAEIGW